MYTYLKFGLPRVLPPGKKRNKVNDQRHPQNKILSTNCLPILSIRVQSIKKKLACSLMKSKICHPQNQIKLLQARRRALKTPRDMTPQMKR